MGTAVDITTVGKRMWIFSEPRTGEPVKRKLFANSVDDLTLVITVTHGSQNTNDPRAACLSKRRTSNGELIASKSYVRKFQKHVRKIVFNVMFGYRNSTDDVNVALH